jgi:hypothetical protein
MTNPDDQLPYVYEREREIRTSGSRSIFRINDFLHVIQ